MGNSTDDDGQTRDPALAELLCFAIYSAGHAFTQLYRKELSAMGLTYPQYLVMTLLWARDGRTVRELGEALHLQSNTLTPLLKRLEAMDLVSRRREASDERVVRIHLSARGDALRGEGAKVPECIARASGLSEAEMKTAIALVGQVRERVAAAATQE